VGDAIEHGGHGAEGADLDGEDAAAEGVALPGFEGMGVARFVEREKALDEGFGEPGFLEALLDGSSGGVSAGADNFFEDGVDAEVKLFGFDVTKLAGGDDDLVGEGDAAVGTATPADTVGVVEEIGEVAEGVVPEDVGGIGGQGMRGHKHLAGAMLMPSGLVGCA
jgi:hypothetical protein